VEKAIEQARGAAAGQNQKDQDFESLLRGALQQLGAAAMQRSARAVLKEE